MKKQILALSILLCAASVSACSLKEVNGTNDVAQQSVKPTGNVITENRKISNFSKIYAATSIQVEYVPSDGAPRAEGTIDEAYKDFLKTEVKGNELKIYFKTDKKNRNTNIKGKASVKVYGPVATSYDASTSASIVITKDIETSGELKLDATTSGSIIFRGSILAGSLSVDGSTSGSIHAGTVKVLDDADFDLSTSASCKFASISAKEIDVDASTSGTLSISSGSTKKIDVDASTGAKIDLRSVSCTNVHVEKSTGASVHTNR